MSYMKQYVTENITKILSWSAQSSQVLEIPEVVDWCMGVPNCSTFRVNTLKHTVEEVVSYLETEFAKRYASENIEPPQVNVHDVIPECVIISKLNTANLDLTPKPNEIIVDAACGAAVLRGSHVFAPGVMGALPTTTIGSQVSVYADISMNCLKGYKQCYSDEGKLFVGNGIAQMNRHQLFDGDKRPRGVAVEMHHPVFGLVMVECPTDYGVLQNLPSMVCVRTLDPKPGETILDMCAAPGNKTTHIATLMDDRGTLIAIDKVTKITSVKSKCSALRLGKCVLTFAGDSRKLVNGPGRPLNAGPPFSPETFDRILLDASCSGLGIRPMLHNHVQTESRMKSFSNIQKSFIDNAVPLLKPGGILVYSTCSIMPEENECVIAWLLEKYPEMELVAAEPKIGAPGQPKCGLTDEQRALVQRFGPGTDTEDSIGFFLAKLKKK